MDSERGEYRYRHQDHVQSHVRHPTPPVVTTSNDWGTILSIKSETAVELIYQNMPALQHPSAGVLRLTMFTHESDGVRKLKRQIAESLVLLLEANGYHLCNGLSEASALLTEHGYTVESPSTVPSPASHAARPASLATADIEARSA